MGEYGALLGGPVLVFCNQPCFELTITSGNFCLEGIHTESPAGKLILKFQDLFFSKKIQFTDPYCGLGGLGASTAQFLGIYAFIQKWTPEKVADLTVEDFSKLLKEYQDCAWDGEGAAPSGADLIAQVVGGFVFFQRENNFKIEKLQWPDSRVGMMILKTPEKVATHEHLKKLDLNLSSEKMKIWKSAQEQVLLLKKFLSEGHLQDLTQSVHHFSEFLSSQNFICASTQNLLKQISEVKAVHTSKGCGALGADFIWITYDLQHEDEVLKDLAKFEFKNILSLKDLSKSGLTILKETP